MSPMQKFAWFNLAVIALTLVVVFAFIPFLGYHATGGLGCLGFLGLGPLFFRKKPGQVLTDERDHLIQRRSVILAYALFWVLFIVAALAASMIYGKTGAVPIRVVQLSVWSGFMFVYAVMSMAILLQYAGGSKDAE